MKLLSLVFFSKSTLKPFACECVPLAWPVSVPPVMRMLAPDCFFKLFTPSIVPEKIPSSEVQLGLVLRFVEMIERTKKRKGANVINLTTVDMNELATYLSTQWPLENVVIPGSNLACASACVNLLPDLSDTVAVAQTTRLSPAAIKSAKLDVENCETNVASSTHDLQDLNKTHSHDYYYSWIWALNLKWIKRQSCNTRKMLKAKRWN